MVEVLDVHDPEYWLPASGGWPHAELVSWLAEHGIEANDVFRVELHLIDAPVVRAFGIARGEDGQPYLVPGDDGELEIAKAPPRDTLMRHRPPVEFRREGS